MCTSARSWFDPALGICCGSVENTATKFFRMFVSRDKLHLKVFINSLFISRYVGGILLGIKITFPLLVNKICHTFVRLLMKHGSIIAISKCDKLKDITTEVRRYIELAALHYWQ